MPTEPNPNTMNVGQDLHELSKAYISANLIELCSEELEIGPCSCLHHDHLINLWGTLLNFRTARRLVKQMIQDAAVAYVAGIDEYPHGTN